MKLLIKKRGFLVYHIIFFAVLSMAFFQVCYAIHNGHSALDLIFLKENFEKNKYFVPLLIIAIYSAFSCKKYSTTVLGALCFFILVNLSLLLFVSFNKIILFTIVFYLLLKVDKLSYYIVHKSFLLQQSYDLSLFQKVI